jgi:hypothetical protein
MELEKTVSLRKPVEFAGVTHTELKLREPVAGELEKASHATSSVGVVINLTHLVAKVPRKVAEDICQRDLQACTDFFAQFSDFQPGGLTQ